MTRTTVAVTTLCGSPALNVIASTATAGLNIRVMVGDTVAGVVEHIRKAVADDQVRIDVVESGEPSPVSPYDDEAFELLEATHRRGLPRRGRDAVRDDGRHRLALLHRDLRPRLPLRAVPDDQGAARRPSTPTTSTSGSTTSLDGVALVPAADREAPRMSELHEPTARRPPRRGWPPSSASWSASSSPAASCRATTRRSTRRSPSTSRSPRGTSTGSRPRS